MPCYKCNKDKWKYGKNGDCMFDTLQKCKDAELSILIEKINKVKNTISNINKNDKS